MRGTAVYEQDQVGLSRRARLANVYAQRYRAEWPSKISEADVLGRAEHYYQQLDVLRLLRKEVRRDLLVEAKKHKWTYSGLGLETHDSAQYHAVEGQL